MLKMEYLLEEAKELGLPMTKKRAILREYLQTIILNSIYKSNFAKSMFFVGGTALRFFYNLPRFSEDLDFNTASLEKNSFKKILERVEMNLSLEGFSPEISYLTFANSRNSYGHLFSSRCYFSFFCENKL